MSAADPAPAADPSPADPSSRTPPEIQPDASRVIGRLQRQIGEVLGQVAMLEDVIAQLQEERARAALPPAPVREPG